MNRLTEKAAIELKWNLVTCAVREEVERILDIKIDCHASVVEDEYWGIILDNSRLPLTKLCLLLQEVNASLDDWEGSLPEEGENSVTSLGMGLAEKLLSRHIGRTWSHHLITEDGIWLVDTKAEETTTTIYTVISTATDVDKGVFRTPEASASYLSLADAQAELARRIAAEKAGLDERYNYEERGSDYWEMSQESYETAVFSRVEILTTTLNSETEVFP